MASSAFTEGPLPCPSRLHVSLRHPLGGAGRELEAYASVPAGLMRMTLGVVLGDVVSETVRHRLTYGWMDGRWNNDQAINSQQNWIRFVSRPQAHNFPTGSIGHAFRFETTRRSFHSALTCDCVRVCMLDHGSLLLGRGLDMSTVRASA